jgi:hypothetical protein
MALRPFVGTWPLLQFRNLYYTDGRTPWTSYQPVARQLPTHKTTQTQTKRRHRHPCFHWGGTNLPLPFSRLYLRFKSWSVPCYSSTFCKKAFTCSVVRLWDRLVGDSRDIIWGSDPTFTCRDWGKDWKPQHTRFLVQDFSSKPAENEAGELFTRPQLSL